MIQMVGRGLRTIDPEEHPGLIKTDCIVLDFGTSSLIHGTLEQDVDLDGNTEAGVAPTKTCPGCEAEIPLAAAECPLCGEAFAREDEGSGEGGTAASLSGFMMTEIDLLQRSSFAWVDLFGTVLHLASIRLAGCIPGQPLLAGLEKFLRPAVIQALGDPFLAAQLGNAVFAT
jgi:hypothetical protein